MSDSMTSAVRRRSPIRAASASSRSLRRAASATAAPSRGQGARRRLADAAAAPVTSATVPVEPFRHRPIMPAPACAQASGPHDRRRLGVRDEAPRPAATVGVGDPDVAVDPVRDVPIVEPLDLVVDRARLGERGLSSSSSRSSTYRRQPPPVAEAASCRRCGCRRARATGTRRARVMTFIVRAFEVALARGRCARPSRASRRSGCRPAANVTPQKLKSGRVIGLPSRVAA